MEKKKKSSKNKKNTFYFFLITYMLALVVLFIIFRPFFFALILGGVLGIFFFPLNKILINKGLKPNFSAMLLVFLILILIISTAFLFINSLVKEASATYQSVQSYDFDDVDEFAESFGLNISSEKIITPLFANFNNSLEESIPNIVNSITDIVVGLFIMLFLLFYIFKDGNNLLESVLNIIPMSDDFKSELKTESSKMLYGIMYGQFLIAVIQGFLGGLAFVIFGLNNPVFWGFVMGILAFIPMLGTPAIWVPAGIIQIMNGELFSGIGLLLYGAIIMFSIENIVRPRIIGRRSGMHPLLVLLSIFGGLKLFGVIGLLVGPILVTLCVLVIKFFNLELVAKNNSDE